MKNMKIGAMMGVAWGLASMPLAFSLGAEYGTPYKYFTLPAYLSSKLLGALGCNLLECKIIPLIFLSPMVGGAIGVTAAYLIEKSMEIMKKPA